MGTEDKRRIFAAFGAGKKRRKTVMEMTDPFRMLKALSSGAERAGTDEKREAVFRRPPEGANLF